MVEDRRTLASAKDEIQWESFDQDVPFATPPASSAGAGSTPSVKLAAFMQLNDEPGPAESHSIDLLREVEVELTVELGSTQMQIKHILGLRPGSIVELNRLAGEPVDIVINRTLIARGEVVVVDEKFAIRVVEIVAPDPRLSGS